MTVLPGEPGSGQGPLSDAELVARALAADREAFAEVYDRYGDRLHDFAYSMLRQREDAADAVADAFVTFAERLSQLRDPDRLRPWLYAIVRSECLRRLKARKRFAYGEEEQLVEMADSAPSPDHEATRNELQQLVWDAAAGLADRDRALLDLHLRQGLEGAELAEAMGVTPSNAYVMLNRVKGQVERSLGALLIARLGKEDCEELSALLADWDGTFSPLIRKRVARHVDGCDVCGERRKVLVSPLALLAGVPIVAAPLALRDRVVEQTRLVAYSGPPGGPGAGPGGGGGVQAGAAATTTVLPRMIRTRALTVLAVLALVVVGAVLVWPSDEPDPVLAPAADTSAPVVTPAATLSPGPASVVASPTPTAGPTPTSATPTPNIAAPGSLVLSTRSIDLGRRASTASIGLSNPGDLPVGYQVSSRTSWLSVSSDAGTLDGHGTGRIGLRADRGSVGEGRSTGRLLVRWSGGSAEIAVSLEEQNAPVVGRPRASADPSCEQQTVTVGVTVSDQSRLSSVRLSWTGPHGSGQATMTRTGSVWRASMGPFTLGGPITMRVTARDVRGNVATGPTGSATATPCPG